MSDEAKKLAEEMRDLWDAAVAGLEVHYPILEWADRIEALGGEQARSVRKQGHGHDTGPSVPATPCRCEHPLSDHSQSNPAHCHHEWCMCEEYVPDGGEICGCSDQNNEGKVLVTGNLSRESDVVGALRSSELLGGEQAEGPRADLGAAVSARPPGPITKEHIEQCFKCPECGGELRDYAEVFDIPHNLPFIACTKCHWYGPRGYSPEPENEEIQGCACKPCRFCGEPESVGVIEEVYPNSFWVQCDYCKATGPEASTREEALKRWNEGGER